MWFVKDTAAALKIEWGGLKSTLKQSQLFFCQEKKLSYQQTLIEHRNVSLLSSFSKFSCRSDLKLLLHDEQEETRTNGGSHALDQTTPDCPVLLLLCSFSLNDAFCVFLSQQHWKICWPFLHRNIYFCHRLQEQQQLPGRHEETSWHRLSRGFLFCRASGLGLTPGLLSRKTSMNFKDPAWRVKSAFVICILDLASDTTFSSSKYVWRSASKMTLFDQI